MGRRRYELRVPRLDEINESFPETPTNIAAETGYYWGSVAEGVPHHAAEELFTALEGPADPVLTVLLHDPERALTPDWPLDPSQRHVLPWWMAITGLPQHDRPALPLPPARSSI
ncbi:hypothetical protein ABZ371_06880 [Streptomyces sp. NPDC005899]|uniref:hypothetical protein n=1 Tax=Streptomyces sp. NPDC005899 TaxID=3155716 RepID=UPI0033E5EA43